MNDDVRVGISKIGSQNSRNGGLNKKKPADSRNSQQLDS